MTNPRNWAFVCLILAPPVLVVYAFDHDPMLLFTGSVVFATGLFVFLFAERT